jgi:small subunit ribosomal protein S20
VAVAGKDKAVAETAYADFVKLIDTASGKGLYHRNTAARKKSRMHKRLVALA